MRGINATLNNIDRRVGTQQMYKPGERMVGASTVAPDTGDPAFSCEYMYVQANETLNPGEIVKLVTTSLDTVSACKVGKTGTSTNENALVLGAVPGVLHDVYGDPLATVASGSYFWLAIRGVTEVLDVGTAAAGDVINASATAGKVASAPSGSTAFSLGVVLVAKDPAGLTKCLFRSPLA